MAYFCSHKKLMLKTLSRSISNVLSAARFCSTKLKNPIDRTWDSISRDIIDNKSDKIFYPEHTDIVIIGGGFIGASAAYWLKTRAGDGLSIVLIEKDFNYPGIKNNVVLGNLTQHFSLLENIYLSQYAVEFLRNIKTNLNSDLDIEYRPSGNLVLASEKYAERLELNVALLKEHGVSHELLTTADIQEKYPWINTEDIKLGCISTESEGSFNSWALFNGLIVKCQDLGVTFVNGEVVDFEMEEQRDALMEGVSPGGFKKINKVVYKTSDGEKHSLKFAVSILSAGDKSGEVAKLAKIGLGDTSLLTIPLPIERREFDIYGIQNLDQIKSYIDTPFIMDTSGLWLRSNSIEKMFLCGTTPPLTGHVKESLSESYYADVIEPSLMNRYPTIKKEQITKLKMEYHDCNTYDDTGILGQHPYHTNMIIAAGFGKLGCQHAPGVGRAIAELIIDGHYTTIDLTRFGFDRLLINEPVFEFNMY